MDVSVKSGDLSLTLDTDYSYSLVVEADKATVTATSVYGAMYGMETFAQLTDRGVFVTGTAITDSPRFKFRATMIDTSRHWYPLSTIFAHLDAMAYNKLNVLHWHLVDSVSFPFCSETFPQMCKEGAFSPRHVYTRTDVKRVIAYAADRGIRVLPEFDSPGHALKGFEAIPDLLTPCYKDGQPDGTTGPLNPIRNSTYQFLRAFYAEIKEVFTDKFVHVGGDEVSFACWQSNPEIVEWMEKHPDIKDYSQLESYYEVQLLQILKQQNMSYMVWEEIFDNGVQILPDTVVDVWKGGWNNTIAKVTEAGFHSVLSAPFYLNYISYGLDWLKYYAVEPTDFTCSGPCDKSLVGGVEVCMWSEYVDATNFLPRMWPRASAVAERGWSDKSTTNATDAQIRLQEFRCKLLQRGIPAEPISNGGAPPEGGAFCEQEWMGTYTPPWGA
mmetsp:Transcript_42112/g.82721  ORF Transcript_42112/g.82721 Transcript_42112/m.82721 type:complete len:441 (-) Transcript_42112:324-1646(-)